jgi:hypothetical protein
MFLGAFAKLRKAIISFVMSVLPSTRSNSAGSHWTDFHYILYLTTFRKYVEKGQVLLKSDKINGYFTRRIIYIFNPLNAKLNPICHFLALLGTYPILHVSRIRVNHIMLSSSQNKKSFKQKLQRKSKHILHSIIFFF